MQFNNVKKLIFLLAVVVCLSEASEVNASDAVFAQSGYTIDAGHVSAWVTSGRSVTPFYGLYGDFDSITLAIKNATGFGTIGSNLSVYECGTSNPMSASNTFSQNVSGCTLKISGYAFDTSATTSPDFIKYDFPDNTLVFDIDKWYIFALVEDSSSGSMDVMGSAVSSYNADTAWTCSGTNTCTDDAVGTWFYIIETTNQSIPNQSGYIIDFSPINGALFSTATSSYDAHIDYWLGANVIPEGGYISVNYKYSHILNDYQQLQLSESLTSAEYETGDQMKIFELSELTATGTYKATVSLESQTPVPWWNIFASYDFETETLDSKSFTFYVGASTTPEQIEQARIEWEESLTQNDNESSLSQLNIWMQQALNGLLYMPPIGYASHIVDLLRATTTATSSIAITHTFPSNAPAGLAGTVLTLDASTGLSDSIASIRAMDIETIEGDPFEKFMYWWNLLWYMALVVWILQQVFSMFEIDLTYNGKAGSYQKSGSVRKVSTAGNPKNQYMRRDQYKSYD